MAQTASKFDHCIMLILSIQNNTLEHLNHDYIICEYGLFFIFFSTLTQLISLTVSLALAKIRRTILKRNGYTRNHCLDPSFNENTPMLPREVCYLWVGRGYEFKKLSFDSG